MDCSLGYVDLRDLGYFMFSHPLMHLNILNTAGHPEVLTLLKAATPVSSP